MGWYDAFKGDTTRVNLQNAVTSDSGSAAKNFGDAFEKIGASMYGAELDKDKLTAQKKKNDLIELQTQNEQEKLTTAQDTKAQKKLDDAFSADYKSFESKEEWDNFKGMATTTVDGKIVPAYKPSATAITKEDAFFQDKFNNEAVNTSVTGGYATFKDFNDANPELVKNADGVTMAKISKYFDDKDKTKAGIVSATKDLKYQAEKNKLIAKNVKLSASKTKDIKPVSIPNQNTYSKMVDQDFMKKDIDGKIVYSEGKPVYVDGTTPEQREFFQDAVNTYMNADNSDRNVLNAKKYAKKLWEPIALKRKEEEDIKDKENIKESNKKTLAQYLEMIQ